MPDDARTFAATRFEQASALDLVDGRDRDSALDFASARDEPERALLEGRDAERELISAREQAALRGLVPERDAKAGRGARDVPSDRARGQRDAAGSRETEAERAFREQLAAREEILNRGQSWAREQAVARAKALRDQPREPQKPAPKGGLVEERAARTRADPRRDPTHPQQPPMQAPPERGARRPDEVIRPPRDVLTREGRPPANANDPRVQPAPRVSMQPARPMRESMPGSGPPRAAVREVRAAGVAEDARGAGAPRSGAPMEGRRFPSQTGGNAPLVEGRKFPSQTSNAPAEGRKFPSQHGASLPEGRRYPSQPGADARASHRAAPASRNPAPAAARSGAPSGPPPGSIYCEIDRLAVEIQLQDLSAGGLFVQTPAPPPVDSEVEVFIQIGSLRIEASGHIVQSLSGDRAKRERRRPGFGLLFTRLDDSARNALRDAIDALNSAAAEPDDSDYDFSRPPTNPGFAAQPQESPVTRASAQPVRSNEPAPSRRPEPAKAPEPRAAAAAAPAPIDPKERELLAQLKAELASVESQPPWTVLGVSQGADAAAARSAFHAASKRYHPHAYARYALPEIKAVVTQLFIVYKRAYTSMTRSGRGGRGARAAVSGSPPIRSSDPGNR